ncbi:Dipeptidyl-peptidase 5 [Microbotryomycetes sp. JL201]|nr:Dipeptidyl-peptidase 5 [Microbotryomycetes sp. JL201]
MATPLTQGKTLRIHDLVQLPRPQAAMANPRGTLALWPSTTFSLQAADGQGRTSKSIYLVNLETANDATSFSETHDPRLVLTDLAYTDCAWLDDTTFVYMRPSAARGVVAIRDNLGRRQDHPRGVSDSAFKKQRAGDDDATGVELWVFDTNDLESDGYLLASLPVEVGDLKVHVNKGSRDAVLGFSATVYPDGDIWKVPEHNKRKQEAANGSDIRVYDSLFIRHWDSWKSTAGEIKQPHFIHLARNPGSISSSDESDDFEHVQAPGSEEGKWVVETESSASSSSKESKRPAVKSPLAGTKLECPVGPFGGAGDFAFTADHLVFHAKDPHVNPAWHSRTVVYSLSLSPRSAEDGKPKALTVGTQGACSSPTISPDGKRVAWLEMREDGYEADRNRVMVYELDSGRRWGATEKWDRSPTHIDWCPCNAKIYLTAEDQGFVKLFQLSVPVPKGDDDTIAATSEPETLTHSHTLASVSPLSTSTLLLTQHSLTSPNRLSLLHLSGRPARQEGSGKAPHGVEQVPLATLTKHLAAEKELDRGESFWFAGAEGIQVHGFILFPPGAGDASLRKNKKYPLAFLVHGGPQGAWTDSWSTRWNPNIYAAAGFITVAINPTGSTGYGQDFTDRIKNQWGGYPFQDLVAGLQFVQQAYPEIDKSRMACLGASYGGYMMNWLQGHNDACGFQTFVNHDGVFSTSGTWFSTEELYFPEREFGGTPWEVPENYSRWNPQNHIHKWKTPMLVIHGGKDFRLIEGEGIGVFNTLQRLGIPSRLLYFENENHWASWRVSGNVRVNTWLIFTLVLQVLKPQNSIRWHEEVLKWIEEWTSPEQSERTLTTTTVAGRNEAKSGYQVAYKKS